MYILSYNLIYFILTYLIPLVVMGVCYLQMGRRLWSREVIGEETPSVKKSRKTKQKVMLIHALNSTFYNLGSSKSFETISRL